MVQSLLSVVVINHGTCDQCSLSNADIFTRGMKWRPLYFRRDVFLVRNFRLSENFYEIKFITLLFTFNFLFTSLYFDCRSFSPFGFFISNWWILSRQMWTVLRACFRFEYYSIRLARGSFDFMGKSRQLLYNGNNWETAILTFEKENHTRFFIRIRFIRN